MKRICNYTLILLACFSMNALAGVALKKDFHETYAVTDKTSLQVANRFGSIVIENTTNPEISISIEVKVEAVSERKAQDILDRIDIIINKVGHTVSAYTQIENASWRGNVELDINYRIVMPAYINTTLEMRYGDVDIDALTGAFSGDIKYGELKANRLENLKGGINTLVLAYCDASYIGFIDRMNLDMAYSDCRIMRGQALNFELKYSDVEIGNIKMLNGDMAYSDVAIQRCNNVLIEAKYSDLSIKNVVESLEVQAKYSDVDVDELALDFVLCKVDIAYGDVDVVVNPGASYQANIETSYGDIRYPNLVINRRDKEGANQSVSGYLGQPNAASHIQIEARYGDVSLR